MDTENFISIFLHKSRLLFFVLALMSLYACASSSSHQSGKAATIDDKSVSGSAKISAVSEQTGMVSTDESIAADSLVESTEMKAPRIIESCENEPYVKYEKQARESIAKGLSATKAKKYGVGFSDLNEHKKWRNIHNTLFKKVNDACSDLSKCAKQNPKEKSTKCSKQANIFNEWHNMAERFTKNVKMVETTQPDRICSFEPNLNDAPQCFYTLADNIDKVCDSAMCKETGDCWRGIGSLDTVIIQAATSCGYVLKELSDCRGYTDATNRRVKKFKQCKEMQGQLNIIKYPAL